MNKTAFNIMASIRQKQAKIIEIERKLEYSLRLQELWPEVFECGPISTKKERIYKPTLMKIIDLKKTKLKVQRSDGVSKEWSIGDINVGLWEDIFNDMIPIQKICRLRKTR